jgi:transcriptional regulator with XRE-family HTH domain
MKDIQEIILEKPSKLIQEIEFDNSNKAWLDISAEIAYEILDRLDELGKSQKDLAKMIGVSPQRINKIVQGSVNLSLKTIVKISQALEIELIRVPNGMFGHEEYDSESAYIPAKQVAEPETEYEKG